MFVKCSVFGMEGCAASCLCVLCSVSCFPSTQSLEVAGTDASQAWEDECAVTIVDDSIWDMFLGCNNLCWAYNLLFICHTLRMAVEQDSIGHLTIHHLTWKSGVTFLCMWLL